MAGHVPDGARRAFAQRPTAFGPGATAEPGMAESGNRLGTRLAGRRPLAARLPVPRAAELSAVASEHRRQLIPRPAQVHPEKQPASRRLLLFFAGTDTVIAEVSGQAPMTLQAFLLSHKLPSLRARSQPQHDAAPMQ